MSKPLGTSNSGIASSVSSSATAGTILAADTTFARMGVSIYNDSSAVLYLLLGTGTASSTNYTCAVAAAGYYETPFNYAGIISGIWASANGAARVTEFRV